MSNSTEQHREFAASQTEIPLAIITVSDTRTPETDSNGAYLNERITSAGHRVVFYTIVKDEAEQVENALQQALASQARVILFNGGTGIARRDRTYDVLARKLEKTLPGFGELFRLLSYEQVGTAAMLSRAVAGVYQGAVVFSTPGSHDAVRLAWEEMIFPELQHVAWELVR
jgi:molybdenum cofactor biosynthesis protein B